ncbi:ribonuclease T2 [Pinisolibacter sp.]|uniref:ribonuclease T2 n=1 Tax=Pinisolibacter sp. TaxID=2172024 RepID=UPI002FDDAE8A
MTRAVFALVALLVACLAADPAAAQNRGRPGDFDLWVLSLSWSPSWCEATGDARGDAQCARPYSFVVHGLWPQYHRGWPADCNAAKAPPSREQVRDMLDIMPSPGLIQHEWRKHGTCSGLSGEVYLRIIRKLYEKIRIPDEFKDTSRPRMVSTREVEAAFVSANKGLDPDEIAVQCDSRRLQEVRICLKKDLSAFVSCGETERRSCRLDRLYLPAVRNGAR